jgi:hypothetical protein
MVVHTSLRGVFIIVVCELPEIIGGEGSKVL